MAIKRRKKLIGSAERGISLTVLTDSKLKTNSFIVHFINPLTAEKASSAAAVAFALEDTCSAYPSMTAFNRQLAKLYGASIRSGISRFSDSQVITFSGSCIADKYALNGEQTTKELLEILCGCIFDPVTENGSLPEKNFALKKQELLDDIDADINDKRNYAIKKAAAVIFENEPSGIPVKGERSAAENVTADSAYEAYKNILKHGRVEIFFAGCELPQECERLIEEKFSLPERGEIYRPEITASPVKNETRFVTERLDISQSKMVMAFKFPENMRDRAVARLFGAVFGGTPFSLLFKNVREKLSLCYYCSASVNYNKCAVFVDSGVENANIDAAREEIINQLESMKKGDFSEELLSQSKLYLSSALKGVNDTPRAAADWYFGYCLESEENTPSPEQFIDMINSVTKEQVVELAKAMKLDSVYVLTGKEETV